MVQVQEESGDASSNARQTVGACYKELKQYAHEVVIARCVWCTHRRKRAVELSGNELSDGRWHNAIVAGSTAQRLVEDASNVDHVAFFHASHRHTRPTIDAIACLRHYFTRIMNSDFPSGFNK